jgi:hypothetical protein
VAALCVATGNDGKEDVMMILSDAPAVIDVDATWSTFASLKCIAKDLLHIALKVEQANGQKTNEFSRAIRRCLVKFRQGGFPNACYYRHGLDANRDSLAGSTLQGKVDMLQVSTAEAVYNKIWSKEYPERKYLHIDLFVNDLAAICKKFPAFCARPIPGSRSTVMSSLQYATTARELNYITNFANFVSRNGDIEVPFGTTPNEAFHLQVKGYFRNIQVQTQRHAKAVCSVMTTARLMSGWMRSIETITELQEHERLRRVADILMSTYPIKFTPKIKCNVVGNEKVQTFVEV